MRYHDTDLLFTDLISSESYTNFLLVNKHILWKIKLK